jgi:hypothetical protein
MRWLSGLFAKAKPRTWRVVKHEVLDESLSWTRYVIESSDGLVRDLRGGPSWWRYYPSGEYAEGLHGKLQEWEAQREWYKKEGKAWP